MKKEKVTEILTALIPAAVTALCVFIFWNTYYETNDDAAIRNILSGAFTGKTSPMTVYIMYPLAALVSLLYKIVPIVPWFGFLEHLAVFGSLYLISYSMTKRFQNTQLKICVSVLSGILFNAFLLYRVIYVQYTTVAGIVAAAGIVSFFFLDDKKDGKKFFVSAIPCIACEVIAFCMRPNMVLVEMPLIGIAYIIKWIKGSKEAESKCFNGKNLLKFFLPAATVLVLIGASFLVNKAAYSSPEWKEYLEFNDTRTTLYDFQYNIPDYESTIDLYNDAGLDETDVRILRDYNIEIDERINNDSLSKLTDYNENTLGMGYFKMDRVTAFYHYKKILHHTEDYEYAHLMIFLYAAALIAGILSKDFGIAAGTIGLFAARSLGWMYLIMRQRFPDRVMVPFCFCEAAILVAFIVFAVTKKDRIIKQTVFIVLVAAALVPLIVTGVKRSNEERQKRLSSDADYAALKDYFAENGDNFYAIDVLSSIEFSDRIYAGREDAYKNYEICGGWIADSPMYKEKLAGSGIKFIPDALLENNAFFVAKDDRDTEWLKMYYLARGREIELEAVDEVKGGGGSRFAVWAIKEK